MSPTQQARTAGTRRGAPQGAWPSGGPTLQAEKGSGHGIAHSKDAHIQGFESCHEAYSAAVPHPACRSPLAEQNAFAGLYSWAVDDVDCGTYDINLDCVLATVPEDPDEEHRSKHQVWHLASLSEVSGTAALQGPAELTSLASAPGVVQSINSFAEARFGFRAEDGAGNLIVVDMPFADPSELVTFVTMLAWNRDMAQACPETQYTYELLQELQDTGAAAEGPVAGFVGHALDTVHGGWAKRDDYLRQFLEKHASMMGA